MTKFKFSRRWLLAALLTLGLAIPAIGLAGKGGGKPGGGGGGTDLPPVRYRIAFPAMPANATGGVNIDDINNLGQVVGWYSTADGHRAFLYDAKVNANSVIDLNTLVQTGLPDGWHLSSAVGINDKMVIVGCIEPTGGPIGQFRQPIAIDLGTETPVVDLLPDVGVDNSYGKHINENGDILGVYQTENGYYAWFFNPGLYDGNPQVRAERDGLPLDMTQQVPQRLESLGGRAHFFHLNNAVGTAPPQIAGEFDNGIAFRYTTGDSPVLETFPELNLYVDGLDGLNDSGTFCGTLYFPKIGKSKAYTVPFRYNTTLDELPALSDITTGINSSGDLIFGNYIYRDDWAADYGRAYVPIDDLVVGTEADLATWFSGTSFAMWELSDRAGASNSGTIAGNLGGVAPSPILFVLTPEPEIAL